VGINGGNANGKRASRDWEIDPERQGTAQPRVLLRLKRRYSEYETNTPLGEVGRSERSWNEKAKCIYPPPVRSQPF